MLYIIIVLYIILHIANINISYDIVNRKSALKTTSTLVGGVIILYTLVH